LTSVPPPGGHGGDVEAVASALGLDPTSLTDLSVSLNPFAPDVAGVAGRHLGSLRRYPTRERATAALAEVIDVEVSQVVLTNGGSEAIALVAAELGGGVVCEPEFSLHPRSGSGPRWRSNPHNPSGLLAGAEEQADVWDEAFYPLAAGEWTRGDGDVVVGSLTKVFACPGLRLGYVLAPDAERLARSQPEWPVSSLALAVLPELLAQADLTQWRDQIATRRSEVAALFEQRDLPVRVADAPWLLVEAPGLRERLAPHGVLVRDCATFGMAGWARVGLPRDHEVAVLASALERLEPA